MYLPVTRIFLEGLRCISMHVVRICEGAGTLNSEDPEINSKTLPKMFRLSFTSGNTIVSNCLIYAIVSKQNKVHFTTNIYNTSLLQSCF